MKSKLSTVLVILLLHSVVDCKRLKQTDGSMEADENPSGTLMIGQLVLAPILAGVGLKFLVLLPLLLSKIALLGILSFVSSNLSLLISALTGIKNFFFDGKPAMDDHEEGGHHNPYDASSEHGNVKWKHGQEHVYVMKPSHVHKHKKHKNNHNYAKHEHGSQKPVFKAFKLLDHIQQTVKDHFHKHKDKHHNGRGKYHDYEDSLDHVPKNEGTDYDNNHYHKYKFEDDENDENIESHQGSPPHYENYDNALESLAAGDDDNGKMERYNSERRADFQMHGTAGYNTEGKLIRLVLRPVNLGKNKKMSQNDQTTTGKPTLVPGHIDHIHSLPGSLVYKTNYQKPVYRKITNALTRN